MRRMHAPERLEQRLPLASFNFTDVDGDLVTVRTSKGTDQDLASALQVSVTGQLQLVDFTSNPIVFAGTSLSITAQRTAAGDGLVAVGQVFASALDIGSVSIRGDLGGIIAGDANVSTRGVAALAVESLGRFGVSTGSPSLISQVTGGIGTLAVKRDVIDADFRVLSGGIASVSIGGSLVGGKAEQSGAISASESIGPITVRGSILGGVGKNSGRIASSAGSLGAVTISGSVVGGTGEASGSLATGTGKGLASLTIRRDLVGGQGLGSGSIQVATDAKSVVVGGSVIGAAEQSGRVVVDGKLDTLQVRRDVKGGDGQDSGVVFARQLGRGRVGGSLIGAGTFSGVIVGARFGSLVVGGSVLGGGPGSGGIRAQLSIGSVVINGSVVGGSGPGSGVVGSEFQSITKVAVRGSLSGGAGVFSGAIAAQTVTTVSVGGDIVGGGGERSGRVFGAALQSLTVAGSLRGGSGLSSGSVGSDGNVGTVRIGKSVFGAGGRLSGSVIANGSISRLQVGGDVIAGSGRGSAALGGDGTLVSLAVAGSVVGQTDAPVQIFGAATGGTQGIGSIVIRGRLRDSLVLSGYRADLIDGICDPLNGGTTLGSVTIGGACERSSIVSGAETDTFPNFGTVEDGPIPSATRSSIGSVVIRGTVVGSSNAAQHYGIVSQAIGSVSVAGKVVTLPAAGGFASIGISPNVSVHVLP